MLAVSDTNLPRNMSLTLTTASAPIQAYLFARLISGFAYWGEALVSATSFLCIMLVVVAIGVGTSYLVLGWVSNTASAVSLHNTYKICVR